jgi:hypothetical protein
MSRVIWCFGDARGMWVNFWRGGGDSGKVAVGGGAKMFGMTGCQLHHLHASTHHERNGKRFTLTYLSLKSTKEARLMFMTYNLLLQTSTMIPSIPTRSSSPPPPRHHIRPYQHQHRRTPRRAPQKRHLTLRRLDIQYRVYHSQRDIRRRDCIHRR